MVRLMECNFCGGIMPFDRTSCHIRYRHPKQFNGFTRFTGSLNFVKCKVCKYSVHVTKLEKEHHKKRCHRDASVSMFNENEMFIEKWIKCSICRKYYVRCDMPLHYQDEHKDRFDKIGVPNVEFLNQSDELNPDTCDQQLDFKRNTKDLNEQKTISIKTIQPVAELEELIFVKCEYCGRELPMGFLDDHIQQEHVTDIEDNDTNDNDDSTSLSSYNNGKNSTNNQIPKTIQTLNDSKASIVTRVKCEHCSKRIRLHKIDRHIRRKHSKQTEIRKKLKSKISKTDSVELVPAKKSRKVSNGDEHKSQGKDEEEEFYTIYVSKNELEKFLLAKRVYPKHGMFHLKDSQ